jgi:magnesium transporter
MPNSLNINKKKKKKPKYASKVGLPPGSLIYVGEQRTGSTRIKVIDFSTSHLDELVLKNISESKVYDTDTSTTWIDIEGIHEPEVMQEIGDFFKIDQMVLEDILNTQHRPSFEEHDQYLYLSLKAIFYHEMEMRPVIQQISLILGRNWLVSFQENPKDVLNDYKERIRQAKGKIRSQKNDFIFYRLIDNIVDQYFLVTENIAEEMDVLEEKILHDPEQRIYEEIYRLKKDITNIKRAILPLREAVSSIIRSDNNLISKNTKELLRDVYEHVVQIVDTVETQRESITDFLNLYMSQLSNKMNEVMKVLTIFASIFIPLTFIAGIYGMNFENMPELRWDLGYPLVWLIMIAVGMGLFIYFKRKKWI